MMGPGSDCLAASGAAGSRVLCRLEDIADGAAKDFDLGSKEAPLEIFVVRAGARVFAYLNTCPHTGSPLDWAPYDFMSEDGAHIMCHNHGALFEIEDGFCIAGPCAGDILTQLPVTVDAAGNVVLSQPVSDNI